MTKEDVIRMAREAGIPFNKYGLIGCDSCERDIDDELAAFAALVANDVLEAAAAECESLWYIDGDTSAKEFATAIRAMKESI